MRLGRANFMRGLRPPRTLAARVAFISYANEPVTLVVPNRPTWNKWQDVALTWLGIPEMPPARVATAGAPDVASGRVILRAWVPSSRVTSWACHGHPAARTSFTGKRTSQPANTPDVCRTKAVRPSWRTNV